MAAASFAEAFFARAPASAQRDSVEAELERLVAQGAGAWPAVRLDPKVFVAWLAGKLAPGEDAASTLRELPPADLYLACACAEGDSAAIEAFERIYLTQVRAFVARIDPSPALAEEVAQELREKLLVAKSGGRPRIGDYSGRGELGGFLRVIATRTALRLRRKEQRAGTAPTQNADLLGRAADPELDYLKLRYRGVYEEAFRAALRSLTARERLFLKLHYVDGLSIDRIGGLYRLHRATVARRLASYRRRLREETQFELQRCAGMSATEFASLLTLVRSQLFVSLRALQKTRP